MKKDRIIRNVIEIDLDELDSWIFTYKGEEYKLNVEELLELLRKVKNK